MKFWSTELEGHDIDHQQSRVDDGVQCRVYVGAKCHSDKNDMR